MAGAQTNFRAGDAVKAKPAKREDTERREEQVPHGSRAAVMTWVGSDREKAQRALDEEKKADTPRKGLTSELEEIVQRRDTSSQQPTQAPVAPRQSQPAQTAPVAAAQRPTAQPQAQAQAQPKPAQE